MNTHSSLAIVFVSLAVVFVGISLRNYLKAEGKLTIARKIWLRMAFIFAGVGCKLFSVTRELKVQPIERRLRAMVCIFDNKSGTIDLAPGTFMPYFLDSDVQTTFHNTLGSQL